MHKLLLTLAALSVAVPVLAGPDPELGATVRNNIDTQTIDPDPHYAGTPFAGSNGRRAVDAMLRYETGKLKPLLKTNGATEVGGQGGANDASTSEASLMGDRPK